MRVLLDTVLHPKKSIVLEKVSEMYTFVENKVTIQLWDNFND